MNSLLKKYFYKVRQSCWILIDRKYPEDETKYDLALRLVTRSIAEMKAKQKITILDAGCGHKSGISFHSNHHVTLIGSDIVSSSLRNNSDIDSGFVSNLGEIPLKDDSIDIVFSNMVLEHLSQPAMFFKEIRRVLRPGGYFVFSTPNALNIVVLVNRLLPDILSKKLGHLLTGEAEDDIFPTVYKANSLRTLRNLCKESNFQQTDLILYQPPPYAFVFSRTICMLIIWYFKLLNKYDFLKGLRGVIVARYRKITD